MSGRIRADFNGLFGDVLCLSHEETCLGENGERITVEEGMTVTAMDDDVDEHGNPDPLVATGFVQRPSQSLSHEGSKWVLKIDSNGVLNESDLNKQS